MRDDKICHWQVKNIRPIKNKYFSSNGSENFSRVGTHTLKKKIWKKYDFMHFERHLAFQNA